MAPMADASVRIRAAVRAHSRQLAKVGRELARLVRVEPERRRRAREVEGPRVAGHRTPPSVGA